MLREKRIVTFHRVNLALAALLLFVCVCILLGHSDLSRPNFEFLPDMKYSPAYGAYAPNPNFANGQTLRTPVVGTIARGETPLHFRATPEDAKRAGEELSLPKLKSEQEVARAVERGRDVYRTICIACHGPRGAGNGQVVQHGFPPPPSLLTGKSTGMRDGQLFHILTFGQGSMPSFANRLTPENRWNAIRYVRSMQRDHPQAVAAPKAAKQVPDKKTTDKKETDKKETDKKEGNDQPGEAEPSVESQGPHTAKADTETGAGPSDGKPQPDNRNAKP